MPEGAGGGEGAGGTEFCSASRERRGESCGHVSEVKRTGAALGAALRRYLYQVQDTDVYPVLVDFCEERRSDSSDVSSFGVLTVLFVHR